MRRPRLLLLVAIVLAASCALFTSRYRPPHAPKAEAEKVKFPWGEPRERVGLNGIWLRAVTMALDDFLPAEEAEKAPENELSACLSRRENYFAEAWVWSPRGTNDGGSDGGTDLDGGSTPELDAGDGGSTSELDAGNDDPWAPPGLPKAPALIYVTVGLIPGRCEREFQESPPVDFGSVYVIDTVRWRILAVR